MQDLINKFISWYFVPPVPPSVSGLAAKVTGAQSLLGEFGQVAYWAGVKDGVMVGAMGVLLLIILFTIAAVVFRHGNLTSGVINAVNKVI